MYEDSRFDPSVDENTDFRHRDILCMPIKNAEGQIIGVMQVSIDLVLLSSVTDNGRICKNGIDIV